MKRKKKHFFVVLLTFLYLVFVLSYCYFDNFVVCKIMWAHNGWFKMKSKNRMLKLLWQQSGNPNSVTGNNFVLFKPWNVWRLLWSATFFWQTYLNCKRWCQCNLPANLEYSSTNSGSTSPTKFLRFINVSKLGFVNKLRNCGKKSKSNTCKCFEYM